MTQKLIAMINEQIKGFEKHSNEWNIVNQLIDMISVDVESAETVLHDLAKSGMDIDGLVEHITAKRIANPIEVMETIAEFYGLKVPTELPPEVWRNETAASSKAASGSFSIVDFMD